MTRERVEGLTPTGHLAAKNINYSVKWLVRHVAAGLPERDARGYDALSEGIREWGER